jgi:hypothetical protein|tara:strand:- start:998 stop:1129 length:132 start_codon:yes stop_codon:yes gene_type:complete
MKIFIILSGILFLTACGTGNHNDHETIQSAKASKACLDIGTCS